MSTTIPMMAPRWSEQPASPPPTGERRVTPAARALMRTTSLSHHDLAVAPGAVVRLADVATAVSLRLAETHSSVSAAAGPAAANRARKPNTSPSAAQNLAPTPPCVGRVVVDSTLEGTDTLDVRLGRLLRAAASCLRPTEPGASISASITVVAGDSHASDAGDERTITIDDVGSLDAAAIARQVAEDPGAASGSPAPRLAVVDATRLGVRRLEPAALAEVTIAVAPPFARVVPVRTADGTSVIAVREISEIALHHRATVSAALAARIGAAGALAFGKDGTP